MKLTAEEVGKLKKAILDAFPTIEALANLASARGVVLDAVVEMPAKRDVAAGKLILWFQGNDLIAFIQAAMREKPGNRTLQALGEELIRELLKRRPWYVPPPVPHETCFVQNYLPFVNRSELRRHLRQFEGQQALSILLIKGAKRSGKSYSFRLAKFLRDAPDSGFNLAIMDLKEDTSPGIDLTPEMLMTRIGTLVGFDTSKIESLAKNSRATTVLYEWLVENTVNSGRELWIFLDGFGHTDSLPPATRSLIDAIALKGWMSTPAVRLILTDYDRELLPGDSRLMAETEVIAPLRKADVATFFRTLYNHRGDPFEETAIQAILDKLGTAVNLDGDIDATILHSAISKVVRELFIEARP